MSSLMLTPRPFEGQPLSRPLTVLEAAGYLGLHRGTLDNWRSEGRGPGYYRVGVKAVRYRIEDLEAFMSEGE